MTDEHVYKKLKDTLCVNYKTFTLTKSLATLWNKYLTKVAATEQELEDAIDSLLMTNTYPPVIADVINTITTSRRKHGGI